MGNLQQEEAKVDPPLEDLTVRAILGKATSLEE